MPRIVPDNLKTGVSKHPSEGEVVLNDAYRELAAHYSAAVLPGRVRKPKDKASVEGTVGNVATAVIAALREREFATLAQLRAAVYERVAAYNAAPFQKRAGSRVSVFESEERPLLRPLPQVPFEISRWFYGRKVQRNSHVVFERNFYSVPYAHIGSGVDLRITDTTLEVFAGTERLTSHVLAGSGVVNDYRSHDSDLPGGARYQQMDPAQARAWAGRIGDHTTTIVTRIFESVAVDEQGLAAALAVLRLTRRYSTARVEAAAGLALQSRVRSPRYAHLRPILESHQDQTDTRLPRRQPRTDDEPAGYVRGADYYAGGTR